MTAPSLPRFDDLVHEAGLRSLIWSPVSYYAGKYYHWVVAIFTIAILLAAFMSRVNWQFALLCLGGYAVYFAARKKLPASLERKFYQRDVQFVRAQIMLLFTTLLLAAIPNSEQIYLWLFFVPVILLTSKHCATWHFAVVVSEACIILLVLRLLHGATLFPLTDFIRNNTDLISEWLWIGLLSFILHYLMRNIQARTQTIASYQAVNALAADVDMTDAASARQWRPLLTALLEHVDGNCASVWLLDPNTQQLQCMAALLKNGTAAATIVPWDSYADRVVKLDDAWLIAAVAHSGKPAWTREAEALSMRDMCPPVMLEYVMPINLGTGEQRTTVGVLSVGFKKGAFKERLKPEYESFMQGLVNQAKPMLAYARRLNELVALQEARHQVSHSLDLTVVLDATLRAIVNALGFEFATISLVDEDRQLIRAVRGLNVSPDWLKMAVHSLHTNDIQACVVRTGKTEVLSGWDERFDRTMWNKFEHEEMVRVFTPIVVMDADTGSDRVIGTIEAGHYRATRNMIATHQLRLLDAFRNEVAMAIERAQLLERTRHKADVLTSLHTVGQTIASARDLSTVLNEIGHSARLLLKADIVMLYQYRRESQQVEPPLIFGDVGASFKPMLGINQHNVLTWLLRETQPYYSPDAQQDALLVTRARPGRIERSKKTFVQLRNIRSFAGIPLVANGEPVGVMFANYRVRHQFSADERQLHELFAQQAALAIRNAENHELVRQLIIRNERDHLARELHHSVSQALFGIGVKAQLVLDRLDGQQGALWTEVAKITEIAHVASNEIGFLIDELRAPIDESRRFMSGLEEYARRLRRWYDSDIHLEIEACPLLSLQTEQTLLRLAREALNNAVRHARCRTITVRCEADEAWFSMFIHDDGRGFDPALVPTGKWGLNNMRELAAQMNADLSLETALDRGTTIGVRLKLPLEENRV